ncbi:MAG: glycosyltransferase family 2 protein [Actinomycetes bacterium]
MRTALSPSVTTTASIPEQRGPVDGERSTELSLPCPPTDGEKYLYLGREHRWIFPCSAAAFILVAVSLTLFSWGHPPLLLFLAPLTLYSVTMLVSGMTSFRASSVTGRDHRAKVAAWVPEHMATVDVFLPSAGEPLAILRNTYEHVSRMSWPGQITVYVLDDSARGEVQDLARSFGFVYQSRPNRGELKKAGNLRHGYENSSGEVIVVLDADFVPRPDYLYELMPYLDDPEVGIVQSPQYFSTDRSMHWLERHAGVTQEMFYRWIQPSRDRFGAAICVGTCAVYRRTALDAAGGFAQISHSEDVHTGVGLMRKGYRVKYVPIIVSKGICPGTFSAFVNQQYRWCTGSMSLFRNPTFHRDASISRRQRLSFLAGFLYYISTAVNVLIAPFPPLIMLWALTEDVHPMNSIWMLGPVLMWALVYPLVHKASWGLATMRVQYLYSWAHVVAIINTATNSTKGWVATGAAGGRTPIATSVRRVMLTHGLMAQTLTIAGLIVGAARFGWQEFWAMGVLACANAYVVLPSLWVALPQGLTDSVRASLRRLTKSVPAAEGSPTPSSIHRAGSRAVDAGA